MTIPRSIQLTLAIIDEAGAWESFRIRVSSIFNGGSIAHPQFEQNRALASLGFRHFVQEIGMGMRSGCAPHQSQNRASGLFKRKHFEHVIITVPDPFGSIGTETDARIDYRIDLEEFVLEKDIYRCWCRQEITFTHVTLT